MAAHVAYEICSDASLYEAPLSIVPLEAVVVPADDLLAKNISTIEQIKARGGPVIAVTSADMRALGVASATGCISAAGALIAGPRFKPWLRPTKN